MNTLQSFTLKDADGVEHRYAVELHGAVDGQEVVWQIAAVAAEPLGRLVAGALTSAKDVKDLLDQPLDKVLAQIDFAKLGGDVRHVIQSGAMPALVRKVLARTLRDGKDLSSDVNFNGAFTANYMELAQAVGEVVQRNRFLGVLSTSSSANG